MSENTGFVQPSNPLPLSLHPEKGGEDRVLEHDVKKVPSRGSITPESREVANIEHLAQQFLPEGVSSGVEKTRERHLQMDVERTSIEEDVDKSRAAILSEQKALRRGELHQPDEDLISRTALSQKDAQEKQRVESNIQPRFVIDGSTLKRGLEIEPRSLEGRMRELHVPGVRITVVHNGREIWTEGYGDMKEPGKVSQAASISKTVTALTVLSMVDDGTLSLESDVGQIVDVHLPPWSGGEKHKVLFLLPLDKRNP